MFKKVSTAFFYMVRPLVVLPIIVVLSGCGLQGPLTLPQVPSPPAPLNSPPNPSSE